MQSKKLRTHVAALMLLAPVAATLVAQPAAAQQRAVVQPSITTMAINADAGLSPGSTLRIQVSATPNASRATLALGESGVIVPLKQQGAGNYSGSYVVRRSDRLDPLQMMTARVTYGSRTYSRQFNYPAGFQAQAMGAAPAATQNTIERFVMRSMGRPEPGREIRFRLVGAPGGDAWMDIPGVINGVDLAETRPGVYEGSYTVRRRDNLDAFRNAVASLRTGNARATARIDNNWREPEPQQARDERAPQINDLLPANGERVGDRGRTHIAARLSDEGTGIDANSVRMRLNGRDVTGEARVTPEEIHYRGDLGPGRYTVEVSVKDQAGNATTKAWNFDVTPGGERRGEAPTGLPLQLTSHANNAVVDAHGNLLLQGRTVPGATVRVQVESVASVGGLLGVTQPVADATVLADRNGMFSVGVTPRGLPIPGTRFDVRLTATSGGQSSEERLTLVQRQG